MEISPSHIALLLALIGLIVWLVRMESKTNTNANDIIDLFNHANDRSIHHDASEIERRFEASLLKIEHMVEKLTDRFDAFLNKAVSGRNNYP